MSRLTFDLQRAVFRYATPKGLPATLKMVWRRPTSSAKLAAALHFHGNYGPIHSRYLVESRGKWDASGWQSLLRQVLENGSYSVRFMRALLPLAGQMTRWTRKSALYHAADRGAHLAVKELLLGWNVRFTEGDDVADYLSLARYTASLLRVLRVYGHIQGLLSKEQICGFIRSAAADNASEDDEYTRTLRELLRWELLAKA